MSGKRVLRGCYAWKGCSPLSVQSGAGTPRPHDGRIITDAPDVRWGTDETMAWTVEDDGWVWVFDLIDDHTCEAWAHVAKVGDRFAALQPVYNTQWLIERLGRRTPRQTYQDRLGNKAAAA